MIPMGAVGVASASNMARLIVPAPTMNGTETSMAKS